MSAKVCTNCKYFKKHDPSPPDFPGECRRYPPHQDNHDSKYHYIQVSADTWCGEYKQAN